MSRIILTVGLAAAVLALGACASQSGNSMAANQKTAQQKKVAQQKQHLVCTSQPSLGSHIARTTCMTQAQYEELQKEHQQQMEEMQNRPQMQGSQQNDNGGQPPGGRR